MSASKNSKEKEFNLCQCLTADLPVGSAFQLSMADMVICFHLSTGHTPSCIIWVSHHDKDKGWTKPPTAQHHLGYI